MLDHIFLTFFHRVVQTGYELKSDYKCETDLDYRQIPGLDSRYGFYL
jgi:hypothetical protein